MVESISVCRRENIALCIGSEAEAESALTES